MNDQNERKHIFIVGTTYSGSIVLYRLLAYHPDLAWFSQYSFRDVTIPKRRFIPFASFYDIYARNIFRHPWPKKSHANILVKNLARMMPSPDDRNQVWNFAFPDLRHTFYGRKDVGQVGDRVRFIVEKTLRAQQKSRFLVKVPRLAQAVPALAPISPQTQLTHTVRDGKAVAVSPSLPEPRGGKEALDHGNGRRHIGKRLLHG